MAIQLINFTDRFNATHATVYAKITDFRFLNKDGDKEAKFCMTVYANKEAADKGYPALDYNPRLSSSDCTDIAAAYAVAATLDAYKDGVMV